MCPPARALAGLVGLLALATTVVVGATAGGAQTAVDDPGFSRQWGLAIIGAPGAWTRATGAGVVVAVVDSGVDANHPDLAGRIIAQVDCVNHDEVPGGCVEGVPSAADDAGHGTHVAGIVAAATDNGQGVAGVAPGATILSIKVLANECTPDDSADADSDPECQAQGSESDVAQGVRWAADRGAAVINLSLGNEAQAILGPGDDLAAALDYAWSRGAIPVLVAGNDLLLPGSLVDVPAVIVAATTRADTRANYSNGVGNVRWAVAAPGGEADTGGSCEAATPNGILSTYFRPTRVAQQGGGEVTFPAPNGSTYACVAGTSMAAPHVSGALAVLRSAGLDAQQAVDRLLATADDLGAPGRDNAFGSGRINLSRAVEGLSAAGAGPGTLVGPPTPTAPPETSAPGTTALVSPGTIAPPAVPGTTTAPTDTTPTTALPGEEAGGVLPNPLDDDESLPALPLTVAVLAVVALLSAHLLRYMELAPWARRTPPR